MTAASEKAGKYVILVKNPVTNEWIEKGVGPNSTAVLGENFEGEFVDIPLRSWDPMIRESVTLKRIRTRRLDPDVPDTATATDGPDAEPDGA